jgi:hypothetical protein
LIDFSQLGGSDVDAQIDTGVTSGADPSEWDPIEVDSDGRGDACLNNDGAQKPDPTAPAVCETSQQRQ